MLKDSRFIFILNLVLAYLTGEIIKNFDSFLERLFLNCQKLPQIKAFVVKHKFFLVWKNNLELCKVWDNDFVFHLQSHQMFLETQIDLRVIQILIIQSWDEPAQQLGYFRFLFHKPFKR
jgi:hypothetical protein